jgi:hypothetical protein
VELAALPLKVILVELLDTVLQAVMEPRAVVTIQQAAAVVLVLSVLMVFRA